VMDIEVVVAYGQSTRVTSKKNIVLTFFI
jgi:hypothetical protein